MSLPLPMSIERRRHGVLSPPWSCLIKLGVMSTVRIILFALVQSFYRKPFWKLFNQYSITWLFDLFGRCILPNHISYFTLFFQSCHQITRRVSSRRSTVSARSVKPGVHLRFLLQPCRGLGPLNHLQKPQPDLRHPRTKTRFRLFSVTLTKSFKHGDKLWAS